MFNTVHVVLPIGKEYSTVTICELVVMKHIQFFMYFVLRVWFKV